MLLDSMLKKIDIDMLRKKKNGLIAKHIFSLVNTYKQKIMKISSSIIHILALGESNVSWYFMSRNETLNEAVSHTEATVRTQY